MTTRLVALVVCLIVTGWLPPIAAQDIRQLSGSLLDLVGELTSYEYLLRAPEDDSRPFVDPSDALRFARRAAAYLAVGEVEKAALAANKIAYELVEFHDTQANRSYYLLREDLSQIETLRGWGAYLLNAEPEFNALVEAPHPLGDSNTAPLAASVFSNGARGLLIAGAHRKKADLPDFVESVFHQVHSAWVGSQALLPVLQIHGFAGFKHDFPRDAQMVLSTGGGRLSQELIELDTRFEEQGFNSYVYNTLDPKSRTNVRVNGDSPGHRFRPLAATKNEQGRHSRDSGGTFLHLEFETAVRHDENRREQAARIVADTMAQVAPVASITPTAPKPPINAVARVSRRAKNSGTRRVSASVGG